VKRSAVVLTVGAGLAVFLVVLVLYLPAGWFAAALPPPLRCGELGGSIWHGECVGLSFQGTTLGDATWNLAPGSALTGRLAGDVDLRGTALNVRADLDTSFGGVGELRNVIARLVMDPALLPQFPPNQRGVITANLERLELVAGPAPRALKGTVELRDFRQFGPQPLDLGSYQATFDGTTSADGTVVGKLHDLGGPFAIEGTLTLTPPNSYLVQGLITGRSAEAERLVRQITLGATPDASGRSAFSFEGSY
jgi:hypothetical protein